MAAQDWGTAWTSGDGRSLVDSFLRSIRPVSLLDAVAVHAMKLPANCPRTQILSGMSADTTAEGAPVVATRLTLTAGDLVVKKTAAIVAMSNELVGRGGNEAYRLLSDELTKQVARASNGAFLSALTKTTATKGATVADSLAAGLDAIGATTSIVVGASHADTRALALASNGRMGVSGGAFLPGVQVVPCGVTDLTLIAADRIALDMGDLTVLPATEASVQLSDSPVTDASATEISLWQNGLKALLVARRFGVKGSAVEVSA